MTRARGLPVFAQFIGLIVATLVAAQLVSVLLVASQPPPEFALYRMSEIAAAMRGQALDLGSRGTLTRTVGAPRQEVAPPGSRIGRWLNDSLEFGGPPPERPGRLVADPGLSRALAAQLGIRDATIVLEVEPPPTGGRMMHRLMHEGLRTGAERIVVGQFRAIRRLPDGRTLVVAPADRRESGSPWRTQLALLALGTLALLIPLAWWLARRMTRPIRAFAAAAERIGRDSSAPPIPPEGPAEIAAAADALNRMQTRLNAFVGERLRVVAAIAHDLRTPLTRLTFRLEAAPPELRNAAAADVAEMGAMVEGALAFVRGASVVVPRERLELRSFLETLADDMADTGQDVTLGAGDAVIVEGDPGGLRRLFGNLVQNAVLYGHRAQLTLSATGGVASIDIDDDGPGLPPAEIERVFEPYYRTERSRSRETGGTGLGLAIARDIARAHGGDVTLVFQPKGLRARVTLPLAEG